MNTNRNIIAIIPASGIGSRMNVSVPKQYLMLLGKTLLEHTVQTFIDHPTINQIIVAVSKNDEYYRDIALLKSPKIQIVFGGETRAHSVFNALNAIKDKSSWVLVHDAARPCLKRSDLDNILQITDEHGAILATPAIDTMKRATGTQISHTEDRSTLWHALTPQFFPTAQLQQALQSAFDKGLNVTDEASAMEFAGFHPQLVNGRSDNIKVTRPEDLALAEFYLTRG
ncbi:MULTISPECIES: 2-C-methyl-D-erythritol 4-phosphate cytidylyltransferase [Glaesserella]|uniref:2-C-methyl-D-erythritol 4-phosphate cytidylyltransferase n=1 Tax=Glaesserella australis TaxID=2094024 RepID=A0A328C5A5_9PAST|nr:MULTISPECIES: 2-C-methyl-D-erythritol 4-phosphate cytidylyltransferase [Glaesserella]AUI65506.1 2-C-methyl-D-erythritol 4-phosphate cytidylyltransferase [Glaesserella sp. 15-184]RAL19704.1 2-C-methyl-D-erythritol 4-phosphate cytidylyltransferase [Glaesserella australis]